MTTTTEPTTSTDTFHRDLKDACDDVAFAVACHLAAPELPVHPAVHAMAVRLANLVAAIPVSED